MQNVVFKLVKLPILIWGNGNVANLWISVFYFQMLNYIAVKLQWQYTCSIFFQVHAVIGSSLGGMASVMAAALYPQRIGRLGFLCSNFDCDNMIGQLAC